MNFLRLEKNCKSLKWPTIEFKSCGYIFNIENGIDVLEVSFAKVKKEKKLDRDENNSDY